ncbi:MAG TPA: hypothetical protein VEC75_09430, partial [Stellaceae bacterium]|nr:hypothetical protein [Stellaceae bacterium]
MEPLPEAELLRQAGLPEETISAWVESWPQTSDDYAGDAERFSRFWLLIAELRKMLPPKPRREAVETAAAELLARLGSDSRDAFLAAHVESIYRALTQDFAVYLRADDLAYAAAMLVPGLAPTAEEVAAESEQAQRDKEGLEIDQGIFLSRVLEHQAAGAHLCHAMLLPRQEALDRLPELIERGSVDLGAASVGRIGKASFVTMRNPRFLNAEDEGTVDAVETAVDLAILDPESEIAVLRGDTVEHPKYRGRRIFSTGINLTHLYRGKIAYLWYIRREMGFVNKMFRGIARPEASPDEICGNLREKPWLAAVDS